MTPASRIQVSINQLDQHFQEVPSRAPSPTPASMQTPTTTALINNVSSGTGGECIFVNNNLKTMQLILMQNRCNAILKRHHTPDDDLICKHLDLYLEMTTKACLQQFN